MMNTLTASDPVCGMTVKTATAAGRTEYKGESFFFCGPACKEKFDNKPDLYLPVGVAGTSKGA